MDYAVTYSSPVGEILIASDGHNIIGLWLDGQKHFAKGLAQPVSDGKDIPVLHAAIQWLDAYWQGKNPTPEALPLKPRGTTFQQKVWHLLLEIPYGTTVSYGSLAKKIALQDGLAAMSAQAVGNAVGRNPISIMIPCHRVIGANGSLTGYDGGISLKAAILQHEALL